MRDIAPRFPALLDAHEAIGKDRRVAPVTVGFSIIIRISSGAHLLMAPKEC
ncbi:MAG TPA: hypothetical protein VGN07_20970 [Steroidobacteraceae bacterium]|jgi:hypothetical protein